MKKSSMQQHELKKYVEFTVYAKPDKENGCLELISRCLTMEQPSYMFSCNI